MKFLEDFLPGFISLVGTAGLLYCLLSPLAEADKLRAKMRKEYENNPIYVTGEVFGESISAIPQGGGQSNPEYHLVVEDKFDYLRDFRVRGKDALKLDALIDKGDLVDILIGYDVNSSGKDFILSYEAYREGFRSVCALTKIEKKDRSLTINIDPKKGP